MNKKLVVVVICLAVVIGGGFLLNNMGEEKKPDLDYGNLSLFAENKVIKSPYSFEFEEDSFFVGEIIVSVDVTNPRSSETTDNVELFVDDSLSDEDNGKLIENKNIKLEPGQTKTVTFNFSENVEDNYFARVEGLSKSFRVVDPAVDPVLYPEHYYAVAKEYVPTEYEVPEGENIRGLVDFLNQIEMPPYSEDYFKCTEHSVMLEWLLEGAGFDADLVVDKPDNTKQGEYRPQTWSLGHAWVMVYLENREIAVESLLLGSSGRVGKESHFWYYTCTTSPYEPPGTIETSDSYLRKHSIYLPNKFSSYRPYYYENIDNRFSSAKEFRNAFSYVIEEDYNWWSRAMGYPIKSAIYDVKPFSEWVGQ